MEVIQYSKLKTQQEKNEYLKRCHPNEDPKLFEDDPSLFDKDGFMIPPKDTKDSQIEILTEHLSKLTNQLNNLTLIVNGPKDIRQK